MHDPRIEKIKNTRLVGLKKTTTLDEKDPSAIWQQFMPRLKEIERDPALGIYSVQIYPEGFNPKSPDSPFEKWAAVRSEGKKIPNGMDELIIPSGMYAVFNHYGPVSEFPKTMRYIMEEWIPSSSYTMASRPQFEIMGPDYHGPDDPDSREEVWIPIQKKSN